MKLFSRKGGLMKIVAMDILNQAERMRSILVKKGKKSARQKYQDIKSQYDKLNLKQNKTQKTRNH